MGNFNLVLGRVAVKWSAFLSSTLVICVQIPLVSEFICTELRKDENKF